MVTPGTESPVRLVRFDAFEVDLRSGELRKEGVLVRLAEQPFSVLALLLTEPGEVITRAELQKKLWPRDTFLDFDRGLNKAINRLRDALGDSADDPRFIETLPKRGYRFIATVSRSNPSSAEAPLARPDEPPRPDLLSLNGRRFLRWSIAIALALAAISAGWWFSADRDPRSVVEPLIRSSLLPPPGRTFVPYSLALSRNGTHLAFVAERSDGSRSLWIRAMADTTAARASSRAG